MNKYIFKSYSQKFPELFLKERKRIFDTVIECKDIQHVGSTAVPGLGGKGIIDIAIAIDKKDVTATSRKLQDLGYELREKGSAPERLFFRIDLPDEEESIRRYHVHLSFFESREWKQLLAFREYLKNHPEDAEKYADLKKKAVEEANEDGEEYRRLKGAIFEKILNKAQNAE
jgi:GrpB-like predicted nucleotidyltransferase (UPF0157 family)